MDKIRNFLIRLLAGKKKTVIVNANIKNGVIYIDNNGLIADSTINTVYIPMFEELLGELIDCVDIDQEDKDVLYRNLERLKEHR